MEDTVSNNTKNSDSTSKDGSKDMENVEQNNNKVLEKKRKRQENFKRKQIDEEKYNEEVQEQQYKRLMHLLNRSKFYASYIVNKISKHLDEETNNEPTKDEDKENISLQQKQKRKDSKIEDHISKDVQEKIRSEKNKLNLSVEDIPKDSDTKPEQINNIETPKYFNGELREYQKQGFQWLKVLYENGINGMLADEMGLGKTIQVIALLCHLFEKRQDGPYLLIVPLSTVPNWLIEFERFAPKLPVVLLHGTFNERLAAKRKINHKYTITLSYSTLPVVLTTYEVATMEQSFLKTLKWRYIIVDEGHKIKNHKSQLMKVLKSCKSMNRLLMTGTPLQNNLAELWSLLNFLLPEIFNDLAVFESWFNAKQYEGDDGTKKFLKLETDKQVLSSLREILQPFMLRREKVDVCADVPPKKEVILYAPLTELQRELYTAVMNRDIDKLTMVEDEKPVTPSDGRRPQRKCVLKKSVDSLMKSAAADALQYEDDETTDNVEWKQEKSRSEENLLKWNYYTDITERNRDFLINIQTTNWALYKKIINHPYLIHFPLGPDGLLKVDEEFIKASGKLLVLDAILPKLKEQGHKILLFSTWTQVLDMIEEYLLLRNYKYVRLDGGTDLEMRKENIKQFNTDPKTFVFIMSTRAGGVGLNLTSADTVIIYDPDWNPQMDIQAMARCHRIGQTRPVVIYKLCTKGSIDEAIYNRADAKRVLEKVVISKNFKTMSLHNKLDLLELQRLLESNENQVIASENQVFTEDELNKLLDRSDLFINQES